MISFVNSIVTFVKQVLLLLSWGVLLLLLIVCNLRQAGCVVVLRLLFFVFVFYLVNSPVTFVKQVLLLCCFEVFFVVNSPVTFVK